MRHSDARKRKEIERRTRPGAIGLSWFLDWEDALSRWAEAKGPVAAGMYEFFRFGVKQGWACLFGGAMIALLLGTYLFYPQGALIARYDFLTIAALLIQILLIRTGLETRDEAVVIFLFHIVGTAMEIFKTSMGSWIYPEPSILRIGGVPLFTGFMYACVGSYLARVWRLFDFQFTSHPPLWATIPLAVAIYINFFSHHYIADMRFALFAVAGVLFARCWVYFRVWHVYRRMPLAARLFPGDAVHLGRRKSWHLVARLDLSEPARRLVAGPAGEVRLLVPPDADQLCDGLRGQARDAELIRQNAYQ